MDPVTYATPEHARAVYDNQFNAGIPCQCWPYEGCRFILAMHFRDVDGVQRAVWQLLKPDGRGACYSLNLSDGIPTEELAPERFSIGDRIRLRAQVSHLERQRIGTPDTVETVADHL